MCVSERVVCGVLCLCGRCHRCIVVRDHRYIGVGYWWSWSCATLRAVRLFDLCGCSFGLRCLIGVFFRVDRF